MKPQLDGDGVLTLVLNVPGKLNAVDGEMHKDLADVRCDIDADPACARS